MVNNYGGSQWLAAEMMVTSAVHRLYQEDDDPCRDVVRLPSGVSVLSLTSVR